MKRRLRIAGNGPDDWIRIADAGGKIVCTLPHTEQRLARFIVRCVNWLGFGLRPYDREDWLRKRNQWRPTRGLVQGGWQPPPGGKKPALPTTGSGVQRA